MNNVKITDKFYSLLIDYVFIFILIWVSAIFQDLIMGIYLALVDTAVVNKIPNFDKVLDNIFLYGLIVITFFYYGGPFAEVKRTFGDRLLKIKVIPSKGNKISFVAAIIRTVCFAPFFAIIGLFPVTRNPYKSLLDHICITDTVDASQ